MVIFGIILAAILILAGILVIRTVTLKPTAAKNAEVKLENTDRAIAYGKRLAEMVRVETISSRYAQNLEKYKKFQCTLEELFPLVHKNCEKIEFDGSFLMKWTGKGNHEPIMLMSHQDVVEAGGEWEHEPFSGDIDEQGKVWGRGTVDTKASLFCIFTAFEELMEQGFEPEPKYSTHCDRQ